MIWKNTHLSISITWHLNESGTLKPEQMSRNRQKSNMCMDKQQDQKREIAHMVPNLV